LSESSYIFKSTEDSSEQHRLQLLEKIHDPNTLKLIDQAGALRGKTCLEVGAGAGSIVRALAERVGPEGEVWALDMDTRFLKGLTDSNIQVIQGDIREIELPGESFYLVHARYVLSHIPEIEQVLAKFYDLLESGGVLILEEHDHTVSSPLGEESPDDQAVRRVMEAILKNFEPRGVDPAIGRTLPDYLQKFSWENLIWTMESHQVRGGSDIAQLMGLSIGELREQLVATGVASNEDVDAYVKLSRDETKEAIFYATGRILAKK